jgi:DNA-directed RNA polymerase subunit RPC12/RpoP
MEAMNEIRSTQIADNPSADAPVELTPEQAEAPTKFRCSGCARTLKTTARWIGKPETCPYCGTRTIVGNAPEPVGDDPRRAGFNMLLVGMLGLGLGFVGLFFRKYFTEIASFSAVALGIAAPILAMRVRVLLTRRRAEFPSLSQESERVKIHAGFGAFFGLVGLAMGLLSVVLAFTSMM